MLNKFETKIASVRKELMILIYMVSLYLNSELYYYFDYLEIETIDYSQHFNLILSTLKLKYLTLKHFYLSGHLYIIFDILLRSTVDVLVMLKILLFVFTAILILLKNPIKLNFSINNDGASYLSNFKLYQTVTKAFENIP
jgi:hypothetical protein